MKTIFCKLSEFETEKLLLDVSTEFYPKLSDVVDLKEYAEKLSNHADFLICKNDTDLISGFIAYYTNTSTSIVYIPLICVKKPYRGQGLSKAMLSDLFKSVSSDFKFCDLEVDKINNIAYNMYSEFGFKVHEDRISKYLMRYTFAN